MIIFFRIVGEASELFVENLANYTVNNAEFSLWGLKVDVDLSWSKINGSTLYTLDGVIADSFPIEGAGNVRYLTFQWSDLDELRQRCLDIITIISISVSVELVF